MKNFDVNYIVNEEKGIVICTISNCAANAIALVNSTTDMFNVPHSIIPNIFFMNNQYKGVAKCMPEDTFDAEYGKKLAYRKAYLKYATALERKVKYIANDHKRYVEEILANFDKAVDKVDGKTLAATELYNKVLEEAR